jgi:predicted lipoprotein with Yx(FWY)xxD motif
MIKTFLAPISLALIAAAAVAAGAPAAPVNGVLATSAGATLYTFDKDVAGSGKSTCNAQCATNWPPLAAQSSDAASGDWSIVTRDDGSKQWAWKGSPLYTYAKDAKAGDASGDGKGNVWHVVKG